MMQPLNNTRKTELQKMKAKVIKVKKPLIFSFILFLLFLSIIFIIGMDQIDSISFETKQVSSKLNNRQAKEKVPKENERNNNRTILKTEYEAFPREYKGYKVVGKIKIPKLGIEKYILEETTEETLKVAVTKTYGPKANEIGNFCISGHNYVQTFGRLKELEIGDEIILTDTYNQEVIYQVYKTYKVAPNDTSCLNQETNGERELTLITCTLGAIKRNIIKAVEVYD